MSTRSYAVCQAVLLLSVLSLSAQAQVGYRELSNNRAAIIREESYFTKPLRVVDVPTAGILRPGDFRADVRIFQQGGLVAGLSAGVSNRVMFGVFFGGTNLIGDAQQIHWNSVPGIHLNYRIIEESLRMPAVTIGFDSQGMGPYYSEKTVKYPQINNAPNDSLDRYDFKSRGFFLVLSKGYASLISTGLHAGLSYSLEKGGTTKRMPTFFMATNAHIARDLALLFEYDFAVNDPQWYSKGILNCGIRWAFSSNIFFDFDLQNLLGKKEGKSNVRRIINISYYGSVLK